MKLVIGCDHGGLALKNAVKAYLATRADTVNDLGTDTLDSVDYADYAVDAAEAVIEKQADAAILVCTTGIGMSIAANRFSGVRAALCDTPKTAEKIRSHNNANILVLAGSTVSPENAVAITRVFLDTPFSGDTRHERRVCKLERANRLSEIAHLAEADPEVHAAILGQITQENSTINLIASENTVTRAVREASGSVLTNKYAEGYPGKRWYSGCIPVDTAENLAVERAKKLFGAEHANVQPHCGSSANKIGRAHV